MFTRLLVAFLFIFNPNLIAIKANDLAKEATKSASFIPSLERSTVKDFQPEAERFTKHDANQPDFASTSVNSVAAKSYDHPKAEYYRPVAFPDNYDTRNNNNNYNRHNGPADVGAPEENNAHAANSYNSWQNLKGKVGDLVNKKDALQDRISVAHGTSEYSSNLNDGYSYEGRPYVGPAHPVDYVATNAHYDSSVRPTSHASAGYYDGKAAAEGISFDVYGSKSQYAGSAGNDYASYSYPEIYEPAAHKTHGDISQKILLAKSFLIPLASAAVLGIAAALVSNPLLLQLGTVSAPGVGFLGKRKRRDLNTSVAPRHNSSNHLDLPLASVERRKKEARLSPYRGHRKQLKQFRHKYFVRK